MGALGKAEKVYLDNPNIQYSLGGEKVDAGTVRETFFSHQARVGHAVTASSVSDLHIGDLAFEVGGLTEGLFRVNGSVEVLSDRPAVLVQRLGGVVVQVSAAIADHDLAAGPVEGEIHAYERRLRRVAVLRCDVRFD